MALLFAGKCVPQRLGVPFGDFHDFHGEKAKKDQGENRTPGLRFGWIYATELTVSSNFDCLCCYCYVRTLRALLVFMSSVSGVLA